MINQTAPKGPAIRAIDLGKDYGLIKAVDGLDLAIDQGQFFGLLGRNGSGKTTTLHILTTLIRPTRGRAIVAGSDVLTDPVGVRRAIGLVFQESALDRTLTVEENLYFAGALCNLPADLIKRRTTELLKLFELTDKRRTLVAALSGGMRRAVDIIRGVLHQPRILFLDEPTVGLDVINRRAIWGFLADLRRRQEVTIVLTTHYLEEAQDCNEVAFMQTGRVTGQGQPTQLIAELGAYILELETDDPQEHDDHLRPLLGAPIVDGGRLLFRVPTEEFSIAELQQDLRAKVHALHLRRPDLNDVYIWMNQSEREQ